MENNIKVGLVIMASGLGKRFGGNKLMEPLADKPLLRWIIDATEGLFDSRVVVTRSQDVKNYCDKLNLNCILHEFSGRNDTVRLGLSALMDQVDICFFSQGDQPLIKRSTLIKMINKAKDNPAMIIRAAYNDNIGTPVGFPRSVYSELLNLPPQKGGNVVIRRHPELLINHPVDDEFELLDIDTRDDLERIKTLLI